MKKTRVSQKKKSVTRTRASKKRSMMSVTGEHCFWVHDGPVLANLKELATAIKKMSAEQYGYHVNADKNDFANWVEFVLIEPGCAKKLRSCKNKTAAASCVAVASRQYR